MRHLLLATAMFVFGLAITLATASVLQDVAVARAKGAQSAEVEINQIPKSTMKPSKKSRSPATDTAHDCGGRTCFSPVSAARSLIQN
jgi:hypothetical protein